MHHSGPGSAAGTAGRASRTGDRGRTSRTFAACAVLLAVVAYAVVRGLTGQDGSVCTVRATGSAAARGPSAYSLKPEQAANAATIAAVASRRGLPEAAVTTALATAMQESHLRNVPHGDRDSVGLFQQRPSQGWGTAAQIQDPVYSAGRFYDHLVKVPGYERLPVTVAAQRVQRSGYPRAYARHEKNAALLTAALTGHAAAALNCTTGTRDRDRPGEPRQVRERLVREFGRDVLAEGSGTVHTRSAAGGPSAGAPHAHGGGAGPAAHARAARTVSVPAHDRRAGWEMAHWAVANAEALRIDRISYDGRVWQADRASEGWRRAGAPGAGFEAKGGTAPGGPVDLLPAAGH
ncbi:heavy metal transporter [Streptomyces albus]|uniref:heavy metal transporter n=1 Tax=Streptomyces albus TaxID=1888 RepID=UPI003F4D6597